MEPSVILLGDQTVDTLDSIQSLFKLQSRSPRLQRFLTDATELVKREVQSLDGEAQARFFGFGHLVDLAQAYANLGHPDDIVATVLMTIAQLGELVLHAEHDASILNNENVVVSGLCTGLLPAAVCCVSRGLNDLVEMGLKVVSLSFHLAVEFGRRSQAIESGSGHWGVSVINIATSDLVQMLADFHADKCIPTHRQTYLSVVSDGWATISGPPSTLQSLFSHSAPLGQAAKLRLPFGTAAHAPHLPSLPLDDLLDAVGILDGDNDKAMMMQSKSRLMSTSTCRPYERGTVRQLFRDALKDIVQEPLRLNDTVQGVLSQLQLESQESIQHMRVQLVPVGPVGHSSAIFQRALQRAGHEVQIRHVHELDMSAAAAGGGDIAIVGMSSRFPGSESLDEFWQGLLDQKEFHTKIPQSRFDLDGHSRADKNATSVGYGNFLERPGVFDNRMFRVSPREALQMDPLQRLSLMCSYEALEMAGYTPESTDMTRVGTFFGQATDDYRDTNINEGVDVYFVPGVQRAFLPGRLNYHFGWAGPSYSVDSACASSLSAVLLAMTSLLSRQCDTAVAGGASLLSNPALYAGLAKGSFLSPTGSCKTFQDSADGYCRGEGVGVVVMKRLADAVADKDNILAVVRGGVRNYSAGSVSITHPSATAQQALYQSLFNQTNLTPHQIGYVEMHGTATQAGDKVEMESVTSLFGPNRPSDYPLYLGAVKASIGHGEASAGIASLIKSILILRERLIPGQPLPASTQRLVLNRNYPNIQRMQIHVAEKAHHFHAPKEGDGKRKVLLNNFDAAGGNVSLILEEYASSPDKKDTEDVRGHHVVAISGHTPYAYKTNKANLLTYLSQHPNCRLADLAYTTTARRIHHAYRQAFVAHSIPQLVEILHRGGEQVPPAMPPQQKTQATVVFVFTGQGHKCRTMGTRLYHTTPSFRRSIQSYHRLCQGYGFDSFLGLIAGGDGDDEEKPTTVQVQLATVAVELSLLELWKDWGIQPSIVMGHSLGEYAALCAAGVLSVDDVLYLVGTRATLLMANAERDTHAMLAFGLAKGDAFSRLERFPSCEVACINAPLTTVVSGPVDEIERLRSELGVQGITATLLDTPYAFHSRQIEPMLVEFGKRARQVGYSKPRIPVASTLKGALVTNEGTFDADYLVQQARKPVDMLGALNAIRSELNISQSWWIECGPHPVCLGMVKATFTDRVSQDRLLPSLHSGQDDWKTLCSAAATLHTQLGMVNWTRFYHNTDKANFNLVGRLPAYAFDLKDFWMPFKDYSTAPAKRLEGKREEGEKGILSLLNSSIQTLHHEGISGKDMTFTFASRVSEPTLAKAMAGHVVDGHSICPTSVFLDMALSAARYAAHRALSLPEGEPSSKLFSVQDLDITHPLALESGGDDDQTIFVECTIINRAKPGVNDQPLMRVSFSSQTGASKTKRSHGGCLVQATNPSNTHAWTEEWRKSLSLVKLARRSLLADKEQNNQDRHHVLFKPVLYKLFSQLVRYEKHYQSMQDATVSADFTQAMSHISLVGESNCFMCSPYWLDALVHLAGFQVNCNPLKDENDLWVSTGFENLRLLGDRLAPGKAYSNFVCFRDVEGAEGTSTWTCDAYIFDGEDNIIGVVNGIVFHRMPRSTFGALVKSSSLLTSASTRGSLNTLHTHSPSTAMTATPAIQKSLENEAVPTMAPMLATGEKKESGAELEAILSAIAKQTGVDRSEIDDTTVFADLGVDSLMSITISDVLEKEAGISIPGSFLQEHGTVADVRRALQLDDTDEEAEAVPVSGSAGQDSGVEVEEDDKVVSLSSSSSEENLSEEHRCEGDETPSTISDEFVSIHVKPESKTYASKLVLVHGRKSSTETPLFLITDGAGSATAYLHLPSLPKGRRVYALESPFLHDPEAFTCSVEEVCTMYLSALRQTQPQGPYLLGGWSAGAVFAYEVSRRLLDAGETVLGLIMIDMRVPRPLTGRPQLSMELIEASGLTAGINRSHGHQAILGPMSLRLKQHLLSVCRALVSYLPEPMEGRRRPSRTFMIWARYGLSEVMDDQGQKNNPSDNLNFDETTKKWFWGSKAGRDGHGDTAANAMEDVEAGLLGWFNARRTSFGSNGWDTLVGDELRTWVVDADHFSMMAMPTAAITGSYIREAVDDAVSTLSF